MNKLLKFSFIFVVGVSLSACNPKDGFSDAMGKVGEVFGKMTGSAYRNAETRAACNEVGGDWKNGECHRPSRK